ncbi:MAG: F0F1 ATP synthase subunit delta [Sulfuricella denitrificans]|nr:F0F1 ATP synthase subunit delta [Sulfuricella denitrificans]
MDLDWTTFILEIVNFLVLVWILKRFLYRPVLEVIARRRTQIEEALSEARDTRQQADTLKEQFEGRLAGWETEREAAHAKLLEEVAIERQHLMAAVAKAMDEEKAKRKAIVERQQQDWLRTAAEQGVAQGQAFASRLLERLAGPELEAGLFGLLLQDLAQLPEQQRKDLAAAAGREARLDVLSAYPLAAEQRNELTAALQAVLGRELPAGFGEQPDLVAGFLITVGPWVMHANLRDELRFFGE